MLSRQIHQKLGRSQTTCFRMSDLFCLSASCAARIECRIAICTCRVIHGQTYACVILYLESFVFGTVPSCRLVWVQGTICAQHGLVAQPVSAEHEIINIFGVTASHAASHTFAVMPAHVTLPQGVRREPQESQ